MIKQNPPSTVQQKSPSPFVSLSPRPVGEESFATSPQNSPMRNSPRNSPIRSSQLRSSLRPTNSMEAIMMPASSPMRTSIMENTRPRSPIMQDNYSRPSSPTIRSTFSTPRNTMSSRDMSSVRSSSPRASPIRSPRDFEVRGNWEGHRKLDEVGGHSGMKFKCKEKYGNLKCKFYEPGHKHDYNNHHDKFDYEKYINNGSRAHNKMLAEVGGCGCNTCDADKYLERSSKRYLSNVGGWSCGGGSMNRSVGSGRNLGQLRSGRNLGQVGRKLGQVGRDYNNYNKKYTPTAYENRLMNDVINGRDRREFLERFPVRDLNNPTKQDYINVRVFEAGKM